jgi:hypothetical protein
LDGLIWPHGVITGSRGCRADKHGVHRRTVLQALASAMPPAPKPAVRVAPRLELFKVAIDEMLRSDLDAPKKQRTRGLGTPPRYPRVARRQAAAVARWAQALCSS